MSTVERYEHAGPGTAAGTLRLLQLYPRDMNIYGDWGNTLVLARRAQWAGFDVELLSYDPGDEWPSDVHLIVGGGGQDSGQERIQDDLISRGAELRAWASDGMPMLVICGLYQLFGHAFLTSTGTEIPGISIIDAHTRGSSTRLIGNVVVESEEFGQIIGYENHSGLTTLGPAAKPLAQVRQGGGNNGEDGTEGARVHHVIGSYIHGSLLPKNPVVADWLLSRAADFAGLPWDASSLSQLPTPQLASSEASPSGVAGPGHGGTVAHDLDEWTRRAREVAASRPR